MARFWAQFENETLPLNLNNDWTTPPIGPQRGKKEVDPSKDETSESSGSQVKNQVETFMENMFIMESSYSRGSVDLDSLINFP